jgi:ferredoxin
VSDVRLAVDPVRCEGIGICAHAGGRVVDLDVWGYPVVTPGPLAGRDARAARAAVKACPRRALLLVKDQASGEPPVTPST